MLDVEGQNLGALGVRKGVFDILFPAMFAIERNAAAAAGTADLRSYRPARQGDVDQLVHVWSGDIW